MSIKIPHPKIEELVKTSAQTGEQLRLFEEYVKKSLEDSAELIPTMHCFTPKGNHLIVACAWEGLESKRKFMEVTGPLILSRNKVTSFIFASQVLVKKCKTDKEMKAQTGKDLHKDPDATEGLLCVYVSDDITLSNMKPVELLRNSKGECKKAIVGEGKWEDNDFEGLIPDMLKKSKTIHPTIALMQLAFSSGKEKGTLFSEEDREEIMGFIDEQIKAGKIPEKAVLDILKKIKEED